MNIDERKRRAEACLSALLASCLLWQVGSLVSQTMPDGVGDWNKGMSGEECWRRRYTLSPENEVKKGRDAIEGSLLQSRG